MSRTRFADYASTDARPGLTGSRETVPPAISGARFTERSRAVVAPGRDTEDSRETEKNGNDKSERNWIIDDEDQDDFMEGSALYVVTCTCVHVCVYTQ